MRFGIKLLMNEKEMVPRKSQNEGKGEILGIIQTSSPILPLTQSGPERRSDFLKVTQLVCDRMETSCVPHLACSVW